MATVQLAEIAIARSGDKGNSSNIGIMAKSTELYAFLEQNLTAHVIKDYFKEICLGEVTRYELPNLRSLNFILENSLGGGGTETLITDAQGERIVSAIFDEITAALARGDRVELRGFGAFSVKQRDARIGRNPRTGEAVHVAEKRVPFFKTGKLLRERLNDR